MNPGLITFPTMNRLAKRISTNFRFCTEMGLTFALSRRPCAILRHRLPCPIFRDYRFTSVWGVLTRTGHYCCWIMRKRYGHIPNLSFTRHARAFGKLMKTHFIPRLNNWPNFVNFFTKAFRDYLEGTVRIRRLLPCQSKKMDLADRTIMRHRRITHIAGLCVITW